MVVRQNDAGEAVTFNRTWGFVTDTGHVHVRYVSMHVLARGEGGTVRQCRARHVDTLPEWLSWGIPG